MNLCFISCKEFARHQRSAWSMLTEELITIAQNRPESPRIAQNGMSLPPYSSVTRGAYSVVSRAPFDLIDLFDLFDLFDLLSLSSQSPVPLLPSAACIQLLNTLISPPAHYTILGKSSRGFPVPPRPCTTHTHLHTHLQTYTHTHTYTHTCT